MILKTLGGLLEKRMQLLPDESVKCSNLEELKIIAFEIRRKSIGNGYRYRPFSGFGEFEAAGALAIDVPGMEPSAVSRCRFRLPS
jgi:hypothetical protein